MVTLIQPSFTSGEISPAEYARVDLNRYQTSAKTMRNVFPLAWGGATNRPGWAFVGEVSDSTYSTRNIPFQFNTEQTYVLEFGNQTMRVVKDGAYVTETTKNITAITQANPGVVTITSHGYSNGDHIYLSGISGMTELNGRTVMVASATTNTFAIQDLGGTNINTSGYTAYTSGGTGARVYEISTPYTSTHLFDLGYVQSNDTMTLTHPSYAERSLTRSGHASWTLSTTTFATSTTAPTGVSATASGSGGNPITLNYVVTAIDGTTGEESVASSSASDSIDLSIAGNFVTIAWTAVSGASNYYVYKDDKGAGYYGYIGTTVSNSMIDRNITPDYAETPQAANNPFSSSGDYPATAAYFQERRYYAGSDNNPRTCYGSTVGSYKNFNKAFPTQDDDSVEFAIASRQNNRIRHLVPLLDLLILTSGGEFVARGDGQGNPITANAINVLPQSYRGTSTVRPLVVGNVAMFIQEQGQVVRDIGYDFSFDGYVGDDLTVWSRHLFEGYTLIDWCYAQTPYSIVWVVRSDGVLLSLTYLREHQVWGWAKHDTDGAVESVACVDEGEESAVYVIVKRTVNGRTVRYQERMRSRVLSDVRDAFFVDSGLSYDSPVAVSSITSANPPVVTTAAAHGLSTGDIVDFGNLAVSTFDADDGFAQHDASYQRYKISVTSSTTFTLKDWEDNTNIDGSAWGSYDGLGYVRKAVSSISGLWHLEGKTVAVLADGNVHPRETVSGGSITLDYYASRVHVGLPYTSDLETLPIELTTNAGTAQGRRKRVPYVTLRFEKSRGGYVGANASSLYELKQAVDVSFGQPIDWVTGDFQHRISGSWGTSDGIFIRQRDPLPITVLGVIPEVEYGSH